MSDVRDIRNLALVGFMGVGKSSVGRLVAEHLNFQFIDTDEAIESRSGRSVPDIFAREGEPAFRQYECELVEELGQNSGWVIATGGGLMCHPANFASLRQHAFLVCLWASANVIWERVRNQTHRPLLQRPDAREHITALLAQRGPIYRQADALIGTEFRSPKEVAQQVVYQFKMGRKLPAA